MTIKKKILEVIRIMSNATLLNELNETLRSLKGEKLAFQDKKVLIELRGRIEEILQQKKIERRSTQLTKRLLERKTTLVRGKEESVNKQFSRAAILAEKLLKENEREIKEWQELNATVQKLLA